MAKMKNIKNFNYKDLKKGMGIIVNIPGDEHNGKQKRRPGIIINSNPQYLTAQLLSSRSSRYDFGSFTINNRKQYLRPIYLKNIPLDQVKGNWKDLSKDKIIKLDTEGKLMKIIEKNPYRTSSITLSLNQYLYFDQTIKLLEKENQLLKNEIQQLKTKKYFKDYEID